MIRETTYNEIFDAQGHFRLIMDSMARPGKINNTGKIHITPPENLNPASAIVSFALLNQDVRVFTSKTNHDEIYEYLRVNTNTKPGTNENAEFILIDGDDNGCSVLMANTGLPEYPETGATIIIDVDNLYNAPKDGTFELTLKGPGVKNEKNIYVRKINHDLLNAIRQQNSEYPLGLDIIMTDKEGNMVCIPRTNNFTWN